MNLKFILFFFYKLLAILIIFFLISKIFEKNKKPKLSVFLPIYNMKEYLNKTLNLLSKQTLKDIEIIAINDYSNDNSYSILKEFALMDKRIKIFNNTENKGLLYSRAMGIIHSSGEYIINLDPDDQFYDIDNLRYLYQIAKKKNVDIVSYSFIMKSNMKIYNECNEYNIMIKKPKIFQQFLEGKELLVNKVIWNKLIKKEIYLKAYKLYENYIYNKKWNYHDDNIWSMLVNKLSTSKICVNKTIYFYNNNNTKSLINNRGTLIEHKNIIYRFEMVRKLLNDSTYFEIIRKECKNLVKKINYSERFRYNIKFNNYFSFFFLTKYLKFIHYNFIFFKYK